MIGQKIKELRSSRNWTTRVLAEKVGVGQAMISRYESGEATPRPNVVDKMAKAFGVPLSEFSNEQPLKVTGGRFDAKRFERVITDLRQLDENTKTVVVMLIEELIEKKKLKDYHLTINQISSKL